MVLLLGAVAWNRDAYTYLPESVKRPPPEGLADHGPAGLERIAYIVLAGGIIVIHSGVRGQEPPGSAKSISRATPVTVVLDAAEAWLPRRPSSSAWRRSSAATAAGSATYRDPRRRRQAATTDARAALRGP